MKAIQNIIGTIKSILFPQVPVSTEWQYPELSEMYVTVNVPVRARVDQNTFDAKLQALLNTNGIDDAEEAGNLVLA